MPRACPEPALSNVEGPSRRGGKRPGAGAPKGNLNALKHGLRSQQVRSLTLSLAQIPLFRRYLQRLARRRQRDTATLALAAWLRHLNALHTPGARGPLPPPPPLTQRGVRLLARHLLNQTIKQKGPAPIREAPEINFFAEQSNAVPGPEPVLS